MRRAQLIPVFYQGQYTGPGAEPDHYVSREEMRRGLRSSPREYLSIHARKALMKLSTCLPKYPDHKDSIKAGWQGVTLNTHSFTFQRDYGPLQRRLGPRVLEMVRCITKQKHSRTHIRPMVTYSPTQCRDNNQLLSGGAPP